MEWTPSAARRHDRARRARGRLQGQDRPVRHAAERQSRGIGETAGFIKVVVEAETDRLLGAAVLASDGELDLMKARAPYQAHSIEVSGSRSCVIPNKTSECQPAPLSGILRRFWLARRHWSPVPIPASAWRPRSPSGKPVPMSSSIT